MERQVVQVEKTETGRHRGYLEEPQGMNGATGDTEPQVAQLKLPSKPDASDLQRPRLNLPLATVRTVSA